MHTDCISRWLMIRVIRKKLSPVEAIKETAGSCAARSPRNWPGRSIIFRSQTRTSSSSTAPISRKTATPASGGARRASASTTCSWSAARFPAAESTAEQYLAVDELAGRYANGTLRFTTRQGIQFHGVLKGDLKATIAGINDCLLTTLGACGDVERNVMACPAPFTRRRSDSSCSDRGRRDRPRNLRRAPTRLSRNLAQRRSRSDAAGGSRRADLRQGLPAAQVQDRPGAARRQCVDVYAQDLGLPGRRREWPDRRLQRAGRRRHGHDARQRQHVSAPRPADLLDRAATRCCKRPRRSSSCSAITATAATASGPRIKYLVHDWGVEKFREVLAGLSAVRAANCRGPSR